MTEPRAKGLPRGDNILPFELWQCLTEVNKIAKTDLAVSRNTVWFEMQNTGFSTKSQPFAVFHHRYVSTDDRIDSQRKAPI